MPKAFFTPFTMSPKNPLTLSLSHPARFLMTQVSSKADYFSELIIYTSIKALSKFPNLWSELNIENTDTMLFSKEDIESNGMSNVFNTISKDDYLSKLVAVIRDFLSKTSIEESSAP